METVKLENTNVFYVTAKSFPEGIVEAHEKLHALVPFSTERNYFGISRPEGGPIVYRAAAEELAGGEGVMFGCETMTLQSGSYISLKITDYMKDIQSIGRAFQELLHQPGLDPEGYCVEWYLNEKDVICMIRLDE